MAVGDARARRRAVLLWSGVGVLLLAAFAAGLGAVQRAYYSPSGFVEAFAHSIASRDVSAALAMPGAAPTAASLREAGLPPGASRELLRSDVLPAIRDVSVVSDTSSADGAHAVTVEARADGRPVTATFRVRPTGAVLGLLPTWSFASTPLGAARITVAHASSFTVGRHSVSPRAASPDQPAGAFSVSADYLVLPLAPLELGHDSRYLHAAPVTAAAAPGTIDETTVDAQPTPAFTTAVQRQVNAFLDDCAKQRVLQPAGCPFGAEIDDRVEGEPVWSMETYPKVRLVPGDTSWTTDRMVGVAHLDVTVQSLFDGTISHRSDAVPFSMSLSSVTIRSDGSLAIVVAQDP
ncbi:hypothetical protein [Leifsonia sp. fls2-241-R2A-40a]|uniref:hypothetical protein n=1 Tax=Leifsonia sp. fls2-241-R2A-40a TaxID=3040290 RepID=UPI00254A03AF|nr:hypothetical protein [Leifsonia sp. fls2-241-R2A-40a]